MANYQLDAMHSEVGFKVRHLMISNVSGNFSKFDGNFKSENEDLQDAKINFEIDTNSLSTNNAQRDEHLKSADFFDAQTHSTIGFKSTALTKNATDSYTLNGDLTIKGNTHPVSLNVEYAGKMTDPYGQEKHGFEINGSINRQDYGLTWSAVTEAGGIVVSDEVKLQINAQFIKQ